MAQQAVSAWALKCKQRSPNRTHGFTTQPKRAQVYIAWKNMKLRCKPSNKLYGGRGIKVCDRWANSFELFLQDMGHPTSPKHSLDRINNSGDYCPDNCRWATDREQNNNRRSNVFLEFKGRRQTLAQWASEAGLKIATLHRRLKIGWTVERAICTPVSVHSS